MDFIFRSDRCDFKCDMGTVLLFHFGSVRSIRSPASRQAKQTCKNKKRTQRSPKATTKKKATTRRSRNHVDQSFFHLFSSTFIFLFKFIVGPDPSRVTLLENMVWNGSFLFLFRNQLIRLQTDRQTKKQQLGWCLSKMWRERNRQWQNCLEMRHFSWCRNCIGYQKKSVYFSMDRSHR